MSTRQPHKIEQWATERLVPYVRNARTHSADQVAQIVASIRERGWTMPILVDESGGVIAGHGRLLAAQSLEMAEVPVIVVRGWSDAQKRAYVLADNKLAENAGWDFGLLREELAELDTGEFDMGLVGFSEAELEQIATWTPSVSASVTSSGDAQASRRATPGRTDPDAVPSVAEGVTSARGDLWILGNHRVMCGEATCVADVERLIGSPQIDCILTDPPYCSGGFQESGKAAGSIGTERIGADGKTYQPKIANDQLSTRGYQALVKAAIGVVEPQLLYLFTDWRMWTYAFDIAESSGHRVRSMIIWDKGTPGMGVGWRAQHEVILLGTKAAVKFNGHKAQGNVIRCDRTGNPLHPTQKPVELLRKILDVSDMVKTVYDPFAGSGSILMACEDEGRRNRSMELEAAFVDTIVKRWQGYTGQAATLEGDGRTFDEVTAERHPVPTAMAAD